MEKDSTGAPESSASVAPCESSGVDNVSYALLPKKGQFLILMLARVAEPLAASSIQSYIFFQLRHFNPSASAATISAQAGLVLSSKTAAHVSTGMLWRRFADSRCGSRKLVLAVGLMSSGIAMLGYGYSRSLGVAIAWQVLDGIMNSSISMIRCMVAELYPAKRYRVRALTILPLCTSAGLFIGPLLGGFLSSVGGRIDEDVGPQHPFVAPNIAVASYSITVALLVLLGLRESCEQSDDRGPPILNGVRHTARANITRHPQRLQDDNLAPAETMPLLADNQLIKQPSRDIAARAPSSSIQGAPGHRRLPFRRIWTANVLNTMLANFIISGHLGTFSILWAVFLSIPSQKPSGNHSPLDFPGGLGMNPRQVGVIVTFLGALSVLAQIVIYPSLHDRFGTIKLWRTALVFFPLTYTLAPFCVFASKTSPTSKEVAVLYTAILLILLLFICGRTGVAPATSLLINDCTPHPSVRATIHTTGTIVSNLGRSIFPAVIFPIFGFGVKIGAAGLGFWSLAALAVLAIVVSGHVVEGSNGNEISLED